MMASCRPGYGTLESLVEYAPKGQPGYGDIQKTGDSHQDSLEGFLEEKVRSLSGMLAELQEELRLDLFLRSGYDAVDGSRHRHRDVPDTDRPRGAA